MATVAPSAAAQTTRAVAGADDERLKRGLQVRRVLLETLQQAESRHGVWPEKLAGEGAGRIVYVKPRKFDLTWPEGRRAQSTVALHESLEDHPAGVWAGFADGHLEYAATAEQLSACKNRLQIVERFIAADDKREAEKRTEIGQGELKLKVVDAQGVPVTGALVGCRGHFGFVPSADEPRVDFESEEKEGPATTGADGTVNLTALRVFFPKENEAVGPLSLYVVHEGRDLVAMEDLWPSEFGKNKVREVRLQQACNVNGMITSLGYFESGRSLTKISIIVWQLSQGRPALGYQSAGPDFKFPLPKGEYRIEAYAPGNNTYFTGCYVQIQPGQRELNLQLDVRPHATAQLIGRKAPEFREIKAWKNGKPVTLAELEGKVVVLDFWGYWCGPCVIEMPALMAIHDEFKDRGVVVIGVHNDRAESMEEVDRKLEKARREIWKGRDLPFLIALDGGGMRPISGTGILADGATTAAYGVDRFPTTLLIGRDGIVRKDVRASTAREDIEKLLKEEWPKPK